jgi:hypothetical protein
VTLVGQWRYTGESVRRKISKRSTRLAAGFEAAAHQRASRLLATQAAVGFIRERCDAELVSIQEHQARPNPALAAVQGQAAQLLRYDVPTHYASRELLAAALRTELSHDMVFEAIPFPFERITITSICPGWSGTELSDPWSRIIVVATGGGKTIKSRPSLGVKALTKRYAANPAGGGRRKIAALRVK